MQSWQKGLLCVTFVAAAITGAFMSENLQVVGDLNGQKDAYSYNLQRNPLLDNFNGKPFVWSADDKGRLESFLDRNVGDEASAINNPVATDPWVQVPDGLTNPRLKYTVAGIPIKTVPIAKDKGTQVACPPKCS